MTEEDMKNLEDYYIPHCNFFIIRGLFDILTPYQKILASVWSLRLFLLIPFKSNMQDNTCIYHAAYTIIMKIKNDIAVDIFCDWINN